MAIAASHYAYKPMGLPKTCDAARLQGFGIQVEGFDPDALTPEKAEELHDQLLRHSVLLFKKAKMNPRQVYALTRAFDPHAEEYGHDNDRTGKQKESILRTDGVFIPYQPQVQLLGNGQVHGTHEGLVDPLLKHPTHRMFHKNPVSEEEDRAGITRFYRWQVPASTRQRHIDAALYDRCPPRATCLYAIKTPSGSYQTLRYDDGTGDELQVPVGGTAFISGQTAFDVLPPALKSLAVRTTVQYAPHPYVWMSKAHALPTGLGLETEGLEIPLDELPEWDEGKVKRYPVCWKNAATGALHLQVHPCGAHVLHVAPQPGAELFPDGATVSDLKEVREWLYKLQRPGISPELVITQDWEEGDLVVFNNRGVLHSVLGALGPEHPRMFYQCNFAASDEPVGPTPEDVARWA